jgi:transcriptional regulator with XRE-family HTH domain
MPVHNKPRGSDLSTEQRARIEAVRTESRTAEARAHQAAIRAEYADKPSLAELIRSEKIDPDRVTKMGAVGELVKATASVRKAREAKRLSLTEVSRRSGLPLPTLSRLEAGKNLRPTFETLARYASGVGLEIGIVVREKGAPARPPSGTDDEVIAVRSAVLDQLEATIHREIDALRGSSRTASSAAKAETR